MHESHLDYALFPLREYLKFEQYGLTKESIKNSLLLREGVVSHDEALRKATLEKRTEPEILKQFFEKLGIPRDKINWDADWSK